MDGVRLRIAAMLDAYEKRSIDLGELYSRLLKASHIAATAENGLRGPLENLLAAVDEASDLGSNEREEVAWAAAAYWRATADVD